MAKLRTELDSMKGSRDEATIKVREVEETEAARNAEHAREVRAWKSGFESAKQVQEAFAVKLKKLETDLAVESRLNAYFLANRHVRTRPSAKHSPCLKWTSVYETASDTDPYRLCGYYERLGLIYRG